MTGLYVRSNVQSLTSQNQLNRNLVDLGNILTRLSTGLRINSGKDDPAGLIASELLKSDMIATSKAITNTQRANSMVAIADSALGQISSLLNDIKGLVNEAASTGTMTYEQILANQLQVDAALDSIDRIAKTANYLGKNLLDGSLDFQTQGLDRTAVSNLNIYQANFGTQDRINVGINVIEDATHAQLFYDKAGVSMDTVFEVVGNDGSTLVKIAGGQSVDAIADAINLVSDSTGVRAIVGRDATAGQIFLTSAGLDNDINLTALMTGAAAGNYTIKFTAGNTDYTTYTITEPSNGKPGIIDFQLKMQPNVAPYAEKLDESFNGIYTYSLSGDPTLGDHIVVQTTNGQQIRHIEYVQSAGPNPSIPGGVAATFDKVTGKLQIQYDASGNLTEAALAKAINAIDGFEYMGMYNSAGDKIPSVNGAEIATTGIYIAHTDPKADGLIINFDGTTLPSDPPLIVVEADGSVTVNYDPAVATYDDILAALNQTSTWDTTLYPTFPLPAAGSFKLLNADGKSVDATITGSIVAGGIDGTGTTLLAQAARTELDPGSGIFLQTTHVGWNGISIEIDMDVPTTVTTQGSGTTLEFTAGVLPSDAMNLKGLTFAFDEGATSSFNSATGTLTIGLDLLGTPPVTDNDLTLLIEAQFADAAISAQIAAWLNTANGTSLTDLDIQAITLASDPSLTGATADATSGATTTVVIPSGVQKVEFDGTTGEILVTTEYGGATYDEVLAALKNTSTWNVTAGTIPVPPALGLSWTDASGGIITGTDTTIIPVLGPVLLKEVVYSKASEALQSLLAMSGKGTVSAYDLRANNALNITAAVPGTKFENTDVVYVKAEGDIFTETFRLGYQNVYASIDYAITPPLTDLAGYSIVFQNQTTPGVTVTTSGTTVMVGIGNGATVDDVLTHIRGLGGDWMSFDFIDSTQAPVNGGMSATSLVGTTLHLGNVQLGYSDTPTQAAATITLDDGAIKMRFVADTIGTQYNDITIVFEQDDSYKTGDVSAVYDEARKILHIRGQVDGVDAATYGALKAAVEAASPFHVDITTTSDNKAYALSNKLHSGLSSAGSGTTGLTENSPKNSASIKTGQYFGDVGGNHQTLYIMVAADADANDVVKAFQSAKGSAAQIAANFIVSNATDNNGTGKIFDSVFDKEVYVRVFSGALKGGNNGLQTDVTAKELVELINNDAVLSKLFRADIARGQVGNGFLTLFDEAAYYGSTIDDNALQFLGPAGSPDVLFVIDGPNSQLGLSFVDNYGSGCISDDRPIASLNATNTNAAFSVQALLGGSEYDDMIVRMIRLDNNHGAEDSYALYKDGLSNAMAYCSINNDPLTSGTITEQGKFIVYANQGGDKYNEVEIIARLDVHQTEPAKAYYDEATKKLIITVNSADVQLTEAVAAINNEGTFHAEYDFSFNTDPYDGTGSTGPGIATFANLLSVSGTAETVIGNTGNTGGHKGGVLEVYVGGTATEITAQRVIDTINNSPTVKSLFNATPIGGTDAGKGIIDFRADNIQRVMGSDGKWRNEVNMVTGILGSNENATSYMVIHLATDVNGNSITSARDLVKFFDQLTVEQTRGISVSVVRPPGVDNLDRVWTVDSCGNIIEEQLCEDMYGYGLLQPTYEVDDCYNYTYFPIEFFSYGEDIQPGNAYGSVIAQNGKDASLDIRAKTTGPDFNGVGFRYVKLGDPMAQMYAEYDGYNKMITVYIHEGATASQVKSIIENSEQTKGLFEVTLPGNGAGIVSLQDDYLLMKGGLHDVGYRGGAAMLGAADADAHRLILESMGEGSRQFVSLRWLDGGDFRVNDANGNTTDTAYGTDMIATINGMKASADGRSLALESSMLKMGIILSEKVTTGDRINFTITGGGAVIQMGPDVVSNQQIRFAIQSVNTANLGGASGRLYQLRTGEIADLITSDASRRLADRIINEAILSVAQTRGRLGAIQRNTLEPQIDALQDSLVALSAAEAQISNADFAEESSRLTRAQILVQAGTRTLSIANQFPQYAASLLGG